MFAFFFTLYRSLFAHILSLSLFIYACVCVCVCTHRLVGCLIYLNTQIPGTYFSLRAFRTPPYPKTRIRTRKRIRTRENPRTHTHSHSSTLWHPSLVPLAVEPVNDSNRTFPPTALALAPLFVFVFLSFLSLSQLIA